MDQNTQCVIMKWSSLILILKSKLVNKIVAKLKEVHCKNCKKIFLKDAGHYRENLKLGHSFYCSRRCERKHKKKGIIISCENCGKTFERSPNDISRHNYCSRSCAVKVNNKQNPKRSAEFRICLKCGKQFKKSLGNIKYCSYKCRFETDLKRIRQKLIAAIKLKARELQRTPSRREIRESASCQKFFGSWNNAVSAAGFLPNRSHNQRMYKRSSAKSADGHYCDSISELLIDNWLAGNKIKHHRNTSYPDTGHKADWSINSKNKIVFVEYFGLAKDSQRYDHSIKRKRALCRKHNIKLIEIYPQDLYPKINLGSKLGMFFD